jgi:hypothetical protein
MLDESNNLNFESPEAPPPEESNNRTFLIVGGIFAALIFLTLVCGAIYVLWLGPRLTSQRNAAQATIEAGNALIVQQMTSTADAALWTPTSPVVPTVAKTNTPIPTVKPQNSPTPLLAALAGTNTPTSDPATLAAMQTQLSQYMTATSLAKATATRTPGTPASLLGTPTTAIPKTGFFDEIGLPGLVFLTLALIAVIFLSRRMRSAQPK